MCGIVGCIGLENIVDILLEGLRKVEYRGYDSAGICVIGDSGLITIKAAGKVQDLVDKVPNGFKANIGLAHTRWATHGIPNEVNAHPHIDCKNELAIVHNGIIENYTSLKKMLEDCGHIFTSQTDSEVLAHLIESKYSGDLEEAVMKSIELIQGTFGLGVIHQNEKRIIGARRGSPLVLGIGEGKIFLASDSVSFLEHAHNVVYLDENQVIDLNPEGYIIKDLTGKKSNKRIVRITTRFQEIEKGEYKHFMHKEIYEQPESLRNCLRDRLDNSGLKSSLDKSIEELGRIVIVSCGTSWHSALIGKYLIESIAQVPVEVDYASEFRYRNPILNKTDFVIAISQSGETADTLEALRIAKERSCPTLGLVNVPGSTISREVDNTFYIRAGPEIGVASTKAFTSQVASLVLLSLHIARRKNRSLDESIFQDLDTLPNLVHEALGTEPQVIEIAKEYFEHKNFLYLGRGINFPVALEGALKLKEVSYIHAEGYPAAEMKHGPIALVDENMPCLFLASRFNTYEKILSNIQEIKARRGKIISVTDGNYEDLEKMSDHMIIVPNTRYEFSPILNIIPLQLLAYHIADQKGIDPDKPRNLAKSVTVE